MEKNEVINYWRTSAKDDLDTAEKLRDSKKFHHALFFLQQAIEKLLKGLVVKISDQSPPPIHNLLKLNSLLNLNASNELLDELKEISTFNISARYDDYKLAFYKKATKEYADMWFKKGKNIIEFLLSKYE